MSWPLSQDYNEAIQNPAQCFADSELRAGEAETNALGLPAPRSGNFADVYAVITGQRKWAVKCFTRQIPGLQERYQQISLHLKQHKPSFIVDFSFLEQGIRVRGDWYPVLKMEWVEGFTLNQFIKSNLLRPHVLDLLSQLWVKLSARLRKANISHCDLQHGNVLLVQASRARALAIKLVDYDGMCVPALTLLKSIELGHPAYQHPQRQRDGIYSLEVDRFSHLVIYTALRGLEVSGKALWEKYDDGDNLLFKPSDFATPNKSRLLCELLKSGKPEVANLAKVLFKAATAPLDKAPLLEELAPEAFSRATTVTAGGPGTTSPANDEDDPLSSQLQGASAIRQPHAAREKSLKVPLIAAGAVLGIALLAVAGFFLFSGGPEPQVPHTPPDPPRSNPVHMTTSTLSGALFAGGAGFVEQSGVPMAVSTKCLRFQKQAFVELANTKDLLVLHGTFTVEMWVRMGASDQQYLCGDESYGLFGTPVPRTAGWVLRLYKQAAGWPLDMTVANDEGDWFRVNGKPLSPGDEWHHVAAVKTNGEFVLYWDGKMYARRPCSGMRFVRCPSNLYLGVRKNASYDRAIDADIRAFRVSSNPLYLGPFEPPKTFGKTPDCLVLLDFSPGHGKVLDLSGNEHHGEISGAVWVHKDEPRPKPPPGEQPGVRRAETKPKDGPQPIPGDAELALALDKVKETYKKDFDARKTRDLEALATRLFREGQKTKEDAALQYVLLREARDKAADAADADLAMKAVDEMAKHFVVNPLKEKVSTLERSEPAALSPLSSEAFVKSALLVVEDAVRQDEYDDSERLVRAASKAAFRTEKKSLQARERVYFDELQVLRKEYEKVKGDKNIVSAGTNDPAANLRFGSYCCFYKRQWRKGLPLLAQGNDPVLRKLAIMELKEPSNPADQVKLGDGWLNFAARAVGAAKTTVKCKAKSWYQLARPRLNGKEAERVDKAILLLAKETTGLRRAWEDLDTSEADKSKGFLRKLRYRDVVTFQCLSEGNNKQVPGFLEGRTPSTRVALRTDNRVPGTRWTVIVLGDDLFRFVCRGSPEGSRWLDGVTQRGLVELSPPNDSFTGTKWKAYEVESGVVQLECKGNLEGARWLRGDLSNGTVQLTRDKSLSGTRWRIQKAQ